MAGHENVRVYLIRTKIGTRGLSRSLIMDLYLKFHNLKWRMQYGDQCVKICFIRVKIGTRWFLRSLVTNLYSTLWNSKWSIQYGGWKCWHFLDSDENWSLGVATVADDESPLKIFKFKMVDLLWRIDMQKFASRGWQLVLWRNYRDGGNMAAKSMEYVKYNTVLQ